MMGEFCKNCGQRLPPTKGMAKMFSQSQPVEFEDGWYCEKCAKLRVDLARK